MPGVRVSPLGPNNDNLNYIVQVGNVIGFIISIEMLVKTYKGREGPVLVCFIPHAIITFNICNYFTCELADHTWGSMPLFLNVTQHTEYGSQKQQATCSGREPDKKAAGPLCNTENDLLRLTGEQQILSVDLKIRF